jgi:hypothetical protein
MPEQVNPTTPQQPTTTIAKKKPINWKLIGIIVVIAALVVGGLIYAAVVLDIFGKKVQESTSTTKSSTASATPDKAVYTIKVLATLPPEDPNILYNIILDPQEKTTAYSIDKDQDTANSSSTIVINGSKGQTYDEIEQLTVSPDGKRVAFVAKKAGKMFVVVDGTEGKKYDFIKNLKFSPDSQHTAYCVGEGIYTHVDNPNGVGGAEDMAQKMFVVIDNNEGKKYDGSFAQANDLQTYDPLFSKDGKKVTYSAIENGKNIIVADGQELSGFSDQKYPQFIGNSYDLVYLVSENNKYFLVVGGSKKQTHDYISDLNTPLYVGKDTSQIAYEAKDNKVSSVIVNDVSYPISSGGLKDFSFSNLGKYFAYYTEYSNGPTSSEEIFVNGKSFDTVVTASSTPLTSPLFSPNDQLLAYSEINQEKLILHFVSVAPVKKITDISLSGFKGGGPLRFSDDGKYLYFKGWQGRNIVFVTVNIANLQKN